MVDRHITQVHAAEINRGSHPERGPQNAGNAGTDRDIASANTGVIARYKANKHEALESTGRDRCTGHALPRLTHYDGPISANARVEPSPTYCDSAHRRYRTIPAADPHTAAGNTL